VTGGECSAPFSFTRCDAKKAQFLKFWGGTSWQSKCAALRESRDDGGSAMRAAVQLRTGPEAEAID